MKKLILFLCITVSLTAQAQREKAEAYIAKYKEVAMTEMIRTGVPASITLAQGVLESQFGESDLVKSSNNHFGIKCKTEWTGPRVYHDDDEKGECFRVYATAEDSYRDHSEFLKTRPPYAFLFKLDPTDFQGWAKGLKKAGYATSPTYPQQLLKVINDYNLQQYSLMALARLHNPAPSDNLVAVSNTKSPPTALQTDNAELKMLTNLTPAETAKPETISVETIQKNTSYPQGIFTINHTKVLYGSAGTSLLALANQYDIPLSKLLEYNDLAEMDILDIDRLIFIEKKPKKGATDFHTVISGETLHDISQQEGIRLDNLLEYNNFKKGATALPGEKVYLRSAMPAAVARSLPSSK